MLFDRSCTRIVYMLSSRSKTFRRGKYIGDPTNTTMGCMPACWAPTRLCNLKWQRIINLGQSLRAILAQGFTILTSSKGCESALSCWHSAGCLNCPLHPIFPMPSFRHHGGTHNHSAILSHHIFNFSAPSAMLLLSSFPSAPTALTLPL